MIYCLVLGLTAAVAAAGFLVRRRAFVAGQVLIVAGCLGCAACLVWQLRQSVFSSLGRGPDRSQAVVSYFLAGQFLDEAVSQQGSVVLFFPPGSVLDDEAVGTYAGTFRRVLRGFPDLKVQALTLEVPSRAAKAGRIPLAAFQKAISNLPPAVAYVSFAGVPADIEKLQPGRTQEAPRLFVFDPWGTTNWLSALKQGRIRRVVVPRPGGRTGSDSEIAGEPQEAFNRLYFMATPATADEIARALASKERGR